MLQTNEDYKFKCEQETGQWRSKTGTNRRDVACNVSHRAG